MKKTILCSVVLLSAFASNQAFAGTASETFTANADVQRECKLLITNPNVTLYVDALSATDTSNMTLVGVFCTMASKAVDSTPIRIRYTQGINANTGSTCDAPLRRMKSDDESYLNYRLVSQNSPLFSLGCGNNVDTLSEGHIGTGVQFQDFAPGMSTQHSRVYTGMVQAVVPAGQNLNINTYTDTITVDVEF